MQGFFGSLLEAGDIMRSDAGIVIIHSRIPCLEVKLVCILQTMLEFGAGAFHAEFNNGVARIHALPKDLTGFHRAIIDSVCRHTRKSD